MVDENVPEVWDAVVIGSGFGGAVSAFRLAEKGRCVLVLERGKPYPPGTFSRSPQEMSRNFWDPSEGMHGLFDIWSFRKLEAVVASGLGGGSLIYANVLIRKDENWFVREDPRHPGYEYWPVTRADLDPYYREAERMLGARPYPRERPPYDATRKTEALKEAGERLGVEWCLPKLAISFSDAHPGDPIGSPGENLHERQRFTCRLCGECNIGCNFGSKNTTDLTYLSSAAELKAEIRTGAQVTRIDAVDGGGYLVTYAEHDLDSDAKEKTTSRPAVTVKAKVVVLAAGTLGSTFLLLTNRAGLPRLSRRLGSRFSGNGDLLGFVRGPRPLDAAHGPVITSTLRVPDLVDGGDGRGYYVQDGGYPGLADWLVEASDFPGAARRGFRFAWNRLVARLTGEPRSRIGAEVALALGTGARSAGTLPLLGMGRDIPDGVMRLRKGYLDVEWSPHTSKAYFARVSGTMRDIAHTLDGEYGENPLSRFGRVITVHPLGGCPMGRDDREGVVDRNGEVFNYPGLFVADGSVMPGPVGANPSLTIAALAEKFSSTMVERAGG